VIFLLIKFYRKDADGVRYWEAWDDNDKLVIHSGKLGDQGETQERPLPPLTPLDQAIQADLNQIRLEGYIELSTDDHFQLVVQYRLGSWGESGDLEKRHDVEERLNQCLGWTGNGHCDGGDIGSGTINAYCFVVDPYLARDVIVEDLRRNNFLEGAVIAIDRQDAFEVIWPPDFSGEFNYW
jgi:hypothetical protein